MVLEKQLGSLSLSATATIPELQQSKSRYPETIAAACGSSQMSSRLLYQEGTGAWLRYSLTIEKLTVGMSPRNSHAEACVIMSAWSSYRAFGNIVTCSINGSVHAAFRSTYQSPACHSGAAANMRAVLPPTGPIYPCCQKGPV